jgi:cytochrome oxidase assembly protein ShyY1
MVALFVGLGAWQLQRWVETRALIAPLNERLAAAPVPLPDPSRWPALTLGERRVPARQFYGDL